MPKRTHGVFAPEGASGAHFLRDRHRTAQDWRGLADWKEWPFCSLLAPRADWRDLARPMHVGSRYGG
jgi:hypothetical protein